MKITHVIHAFPPDSRAGSENYCQAVATLQSKEHEVEVFHRVADPSRPEYDILKRDVEGLPVTTINRLFSDAKGFEDTYLAPKLAAKFGEYLDQFQPDVVHFHHVTCLSTSCVDEAADRGIPVVYTLHDFWLFCSRGQLYREDLTLCDTHSNGDCVRCLAHHLPIEGGGERIAEHYARAERVEGYPLPLRLKRWLATRPFALESESVEAVEKRNQDVLAMCRRVDRFLAPSRFLRDQYIQFGVPAEKVTFWPYGFDSSPWADSKPRGDVPSPVRFGYVGTWMPSKGVDVLVEAFSQLDPKTATLDIHGFAVNYHGIDDFEDRLRTLAGDSEHIRFRGAFEPPQLVDILEEIDVLVVPSVWYENAPLTIHEAFLAGIPVVTSDHGGMRELVEDGVSGRTFRPADSRSLRRTLQELIDSPESIGNLRAGIPQVRSIEDDATSLYELYAELRLET